MDKNAFEKMLFEKIPITNKMGIEVLDYEDSFINIKGLLKNNINHKDTAFGGSINTFLTLVCWSMVYRHIKKIDQDAHVVIQSSSIKYLKPIKEDFIANCTLNKEKNIEKFLDTYKKFGKARITLESQIEGSNGVEASFIGQFVVFK